MFRIFFYSVKVWLLLAISSNSFSQTEIFDIATYTPPKDWKKDAKAGVVIYSNANSSTGGFCMMAIYTSVASKGDPQQDFKSQWQELVVIPYKANANPKTEMQSSPDGWKVVGGASPIKLESSDAYIILTVYSGFGKAVSVLTTFNDKSYVTSIDDVLKNMKLDKTATMPETTNTNNTQSTGTSLKFGSMIYAAPTGWKVARYADGDILTPTDILKGEFLEIWVQPAMNFSGTMEDALQKSYAATVTDLGAAAMNEVNGGKYTIIPTKKSFKGWEYIRCSGGIHMGGGDYPPEYGLDLFLIKLNDRFERVAVIKSRSNCNLSRYYPSERLSYYDDIENFLFTLQFADWNEPVIKPGIAKGDGIAGIWQGISMVVGKPKPGAELGAEFKVRQLIFFSNGQAYFGTNFPAEGLDEINTWIKAESNRRDWGTYSFNNGKGVLKLPYADIPLRMETGKLVVTTSKTDHGFIKINEVDGKRLNGTYALSSKNFLGEETGQTPAISFTADGKFTDKGAMKILYHAYIDCINIAKDPGSGVYEIKNHSVIFKYTDGRKIRIAYIGTGYDKNNPGPATLTLSFNEDVLKKQ